MARFVSGTTLGSICDPVCCPFFPIFDGIKKGIAYSNGKIGILKENRTICFAIEIRIVTSTNQCSCFFLFLVFSFNEFQNIRVPILETLHFCRTAGFATGFYNGSNLVIDSHKRQGTAGVASPGKFLAVTSNCG